MHRYTAAEVRELLSKRRLAANNNTDSQYKNLQQHLEVGVRRGLGRFAGL